MEFTERRSPDVVVDARGNLDRGKYGVGQEGRMKMSLTKEEAKQWRDWYHDPMGADPNKGRFTRSGATSWGSKPDDVDELYERMVRRGIVAPERKRKAKR